MTGLYEEIFNKDDYIKLENQNNYNLDAKWLNKAKIEIGETSEIRNDCIKRFRLLISKCNILPKGTRLDDAFLLRFLRAKKFDIDKSYAMLKKYYTMKQKSPEYFKVSPVQDLNELLSYQIQMMLPDRDHNGRRIYIFRINKLDPSKCPVEKVFRANILALENSIREVETQIGGLVVILDMAGVSLGHAKFLAPNLSKKTVEVIQEAFPMRFKAFHILNESFYFDAILAVIKPFLKEKIRQRIFLHGKDLSSLHKYVPIDILPSEYGGRQSNFDNTFWRQNLINNKEYFINLEKFNEDCL